jgi:hypothetical protein
VKIQNQLHNYKRLYSEMSPAQYQAALDTLAAGQPMANYESTFEDPTWLALLGASAEDIATFEAALPAV